MLTLDQHLEVHKVLEDEAERALKAARKAKALMDNRPAWQHEFVINRNAEAALLAVKIEQATVASRHAQQYFVDYIRDII